MAAVVSAGEGEGEGDEEEEEEEEGVGVPEDTAAEVNEAEELNVGGESAGAAHAAMTVAASTAT